jgi:hypothetical protein
MTHYLGDISHFWQGAGSPGSSGKVGNAIAPHSQRKPRHCENQGRNRYSPSIGGSAARVNEIGRRGAPLVTAADSAAAGVKQSRNDVDLRSVATHPTVPTNQHLTPRQDPRDAEGGGGETMRATTPWNRQPKTEPDPALALLAGVVIVAIKDAQKGCDEAAAFLASQGIPENVWRTSRARLAMKS